MKAAYPTRIAFDDIFGKYKPLLPEGLVADDMDAAAFCEVVAEACDVEKKDYAMGFTKLFLRPGKGRIVT